MPAGSPSQKVKNIPAFLKARQLFDFSHYRYSEGKMYIFFEGEFILEEEFKKRVAEPNSLLQPFVFKGENKNWRLNNN